jgi:hypothetical protein
MLIDEWKKLSKKRELMTEFGRKMPSVQRSNEVSTLWNEALKPHYRSWIANRHDRQGHPRPFASGPSGSGKTKFVVELLSLLKSYGEELEKSNQATEEDKALLKLISNAIFIHITFANEDRLHSEEKNNIEKALVVRAIMHFFELDYMTIQSFYTDYGERIKTWILTKFFDVVRLSQSPSDQTSERMIYIHLDEINHLYSQDPIVFKTAIDLLSQPLFCPPSGFFYFVLFTGTAYSEMRKLDVPGEPPLVELLMKVLDKDSMVHFSSLLLFPYCICVCVCKSFNGDKTFGWLKKYHGARFRNAQTKPFKLVRKFVENEQTICSLFA